MKDISIVVYYVKLTFNRLICDQEVPEKSKESEGGPWQFIGILPLFDPPRHDSAETIRQALNLGVNVKMITGNNNIISPPKNRAFWEF